MLEIAPYIELEFPVLSSCTSEKSGSILFTLFQYTVGSNSISHSLFLHSDQTQLPQFLFEHPVLQPLDNFGDSPARVIPKPHIFLVLEPKTGYRACGFTELERGNSHFPWLLVKLSKYSPKPGCLCWICTLLTHYQFLFHRDTRGFSEKLLE